jgi:hypothetical protein
LNGPENTCRGRSACGSHHLEYGLCMRGEKVLVKRGMPQENGHGDVGILNGGGGKGQGRDS